MASPVRAKGRGLRADGVTRPFLKWAGGKRQLLPTLRRFYPETFNTYFEPFLGSGAVFFDLHARGLLENRRAMLADGNRDLVACYQTVRDDTDEVIRELSRLARDHARLGSALYYDVRDKRFNPERASLSSNGRFSYGPSLAAMFIYLNRTGYNGLFRLNADGQFNVPAGRYTAPRICDEPNLRLAAAALTRRTVAVEHLRFDRLVDRAERGDFVYFDPPYAPVSTTARFTSYTAEGFDREDQEKLRDTMIELSRRRCHVVLSNSTAPVITELYERNEDVKAAGLRCVTVSARRAINSNATRRGTVEEYVITNVAECA